MLIKCSDGKVIKHASCIKYPNNKEEWGKLKEEVREMKEKKFPVLSFGKEVKRYVYWYKLDEEQAMINHQQTLTRLAERGGLSEEEIVANVLGKPYSYLKYVTKEEVESVMSQMLIKEGEK